jgi:serine kinase of HPr protein (carbohydrate metabolism regulator)
MPRNDLLHATLVNLAGKGVLLEGKSGSGKSDLALRLIENKGAKLVADDAVTVEKRGSVLYGSAAADLRGMLEVRGVGIVTYPYMEETPIDLVVRLVDDAAKIERLPLAQKESILGLEIKQIDLYARENSAADKIVAALRCNDNISR